jgi:hypothetical protein
MAKKKVDKDLKNEPGFKPAKRYNPSKTLLEEARDKYQRGKAERELTERTKKAMAEAKAYNWFKGHITEAIISAAKHGDGTASVSSDKFRLDSAMLDKLKAEPSLTGITFDVYMDDDYQVLKATGWAEE